MATLKTRYKHHNGTEFDIHHHETQAKQVKILDSNGITKSDIEEMLLKGKPITGVSLNTILDTGLYQVKNCTNAPFSIGTTKTYLMSVETAGVLTRQTFFDNESNNSHVRPIFNGTVGQWASIGLELLSKVNLIHAELGAVSALKTAHKNTLVGAVNELKTEAASIAQRLTTAEGKVAASHNHDGVYLKTGGGDLTGAVSTPNNISFLGKNTSGNKLNVGKVDVNNNVVLGDSDATGVIIYAKSGNLKVSTSSGVVHPVFHAGNVGHGSGIDADRVDGVEGALLAKRNAVNAFTDHQYIEGGKGLAFIAEAGSSIPGALFFRDGNGAQKGRISIGSTGNLNFFTGDNSQHSILSNGDFLSRQHHILDNTEREANIRFRRDYLDSGVGLFLNNSTNRLQMYDFEKKVPIFTTERNTGMVSFNNHIAIQGHKVFVQSTAPTGANTGDVWFDI